MKKTCLLGLAALLQLTLMAQYGKPIKEGTVRVAEKTNSINSKVANPLPNPLTVTGTMVATNGYVAGTTMNLHFAFTTTNTDGEYIDSLSITFPAGFTINGTSANPTFPTTDNGGGDEAFNGINGQTITWGSHVNNTDNYGGIWADITQNFSINVTVGAGLTGTQVINFFAKGDEYPATLMPAQATADLSGTIMLNPAAADDLLALEAYIPGACGLTNAETVELTFVNNGTVAQSNFALGYSANGGAPVIETYTDTINAGDTVVYQFATTLDMSTQGLYDITAFTLLGTDADNANDSTFYSNVSVVSTMPSYATSFENSPVTDLLGWTTEDADGSGFTFSLNATAHTGAQSIRAFEVNVNGASDDWAFSRCLDFDAANVYRVTWWQRMSAGYTGSLAVFTNSLPSSAGASNIFSATPVTANSTWTKDSAEFMVVSTGTYYLGFEALNTDTANSIALRLDDINVIDLGPTAGLNSSIEMGTRVFPNPANGFIYVQLKEAGAVLEIYNCAGQLVYTRNNLQKGQNTVDLSALAVGTYAVKITGGNEMVVRKIFLNK